MTQSHSKLVIYLTFMAVIIYNSWPLGYLLNPKVAGNGLASDLEATGQPFNWLFIIGDVITCLLLLAVSWLLFVKFKKLISKPVIILSSLIIFAITTALSALVPLKCSEQFINACSLSSNQVYSSHNLLSFVGFIGLFIGMIVTIQLSRGLKLFRYNVLTLTIWSLWGIIFLLISVYDTANINHIQSVSQLIVACQDVFLILSSLLVLLMVYSVEQFFKNSNLKIHK